MNQEHFTEDGEERISTGIPGLDNVLCGGVDAERLYLVEGSPAPERRPLRCNSCWRAPAAEKQDFMSRSRKANGSFVLWRSAMAFRWTRCPYSSSCPRKRVSIRRGN